LLPIRIATSQSRREFAQHQISFTPGEGLPPWLKVTNPVVCVCEGRAADEISGIRRLVSGCGLIRPCGYGRNVVGGFSVLAGASQRH
jgi:hypothetical protein